MPVSWPRQRCYCVFPTPTGIVPDAQPAGEFALKPDCPDQQVPPLHWHRYATNTDPDFRVQAPYVEMCGAEGRASDPRSLPGSDQCWATEKSHGVRLLIALPADPDPSKGERVGVTRADWFGWLREEYQHANAILARSGCGMRYLIDEGVDPLATGVAVMAFGRSGA